MPLNVMNGRVLAQCRPRHRHQEFLDFLRAIDKAVPTLGALGRDGGFPVPQKFFHGRLSRQLDGAIGHPRNRDRDEQEAGKRIRACVREGVSRCDFGNVQGELHGEVDEIDRV